MRIIFLALLIMPVAIGAAPSQASADAGRPAFVQQDGSLKVGGRTVRLHGIYIPPTRRTCRTLLRPPRCGSRAALALDVRIQGFVYCNEVGRNADGSISAVCRVDGTDSRLGSREDLAAYLLSQGWAVALPGAAFEYMTLERIARVHNRGIWGFQADSIDR
ncbi:MAG: thermonuclease family protein [Kiloniellaceae bacterium]